MGVGIGKQGRRSVVPAGSTPDGRSRCAVPAGQANDDDGPAGLGHWVEKLDIQPSFILNNTISIRISF